MFCTFQSVIEIYFLGRKERKNLNIDSLFEVYINALMCNIKINGEQIMKKKKIYFHEWYILQ